MLPTGDLATFDDPMAILTVCHGNLRRYATLTARLAEYVDENGCGDEATEAAERVIRYFAVAAKQHHQDEEDDLFPALRALDDPSLSALLVELEVEHLALEQLWIPVYAWLRQVADGVADSVPKRMLDEFVLRYPAHADREEREVFPHASRLDAHTLTRIGERMSHRRGLAVQA
ncbi:hemerythrin domain-containing protein [Burkholderiaceae bacterium DAT-1]|nr:hemerythrin domain-containing protein [Burkholderiaceae bacterium DAT-1]